MLMMLVILRFITLCNIRLSDTHFQFSALLVSSIHFCSICHCASFSNNGTLSLQTVLFNGKSRLSQISCSLDNYYQTECIALLIKFCNIAYLFLIWNRYTKVIFFLIWMNYNNILSNCSSPLLGTIIAINIFGMLIVLLCLNHEWMTFC